MNDAIQSFLHTALVKTDKLIATHIGEVMKSLPADQQADYMHGIKRAITQWTASTRELEHWTAQILSTGRKGE
jgi:hypothetical protein